MYKTLNASNILFTFNTILNSGIIPDTWLIWTIKPIYKKKGPPLNPENFRPIFILSCLGKILTAIVNEGMSTFLERNNILKRTKLASGQITQQQIILLPLNFLKMF
jgi:hypothetical protein